MYTCITRDIPDILNYTVEFSAVVVRRAGDTFTVTFNMVEVASTDTILTARNWLHFFI